MNAILIQVLCHCLTFKTFRFLFETGRLAPHYDYFRCVVNIPDDVLRVGEPSEAGEQVPQCPFLKNITLTYNFLQMTLSGAPMAKMYGAATMVGKDERNGRINPALEADDDLPVAEAKQQIQRHIQSGGGALGISGIGSPNVAGQGHTAF